MDQEKQARSIAFACTSRHMAARPVEASNLLSPLRSHADALGCQNLLDVHILRSCHKEPLWMRSFHSHVCALTISKLLSSSVQCFTLSHRFLIHVLWVFLFPVFLFFIFFHGEGGQPEPAGFQ